MVSKHTGARQLSRGGQGNRPSETGSTSGAPAPDEDPWLGRIVDGSEVEDEAERRVDLPQLIEGQLSNLSPKTAWVDCCRLLCQNPGR